MNHAPSGFTIARDMPPGFAAFFSELHAGFAPRQTTKEGWVYEEHGNADRD